VYVGVVCVCLQHAESLVDKLAPNNVGEGVSDVPAELNDLLEKKQALEMLHEQLSMLRQSQCNTNLDGTDIHDDDDVDDDDNNDDKDEPQLSLSQLPPTTSQQQQDQYQQQYQVSQRQDEEDMLKAEALADLLEKKAMLEKLAVQLSSLQKDMQEPSTSVADVSNVNGANDALLDLQQRSAMLETLKNQLKGLKASEVLGGDPRANNNNDDDDNDDTARPQSYDAKQQVHTQIHTHTHSKSKQKTRASIFCKRN
jgi:hypothetical protein